MLHCNFYFIFGNNPNANVIKIYNSNKCCVVESWVLPLPASSSIEWVTGQLVTRRLDIQQNDTQHNDTQHNDTRHNDTRHNDTQHNDNQHNDTQHNDNKHNDIQLGNFDICAERKISFMNELKLNEIQSRPKG